MNMKAALHRIGPTARRLGVPVAWLRTEAEEGRIPCLKAGARLLFDPDAVGSVLLERARCQAESGTFGKKEPA